MLFGVSKGDFNMKKLILILTAVMMLAFSGICMASDSSDLNKEQKAVDTFISAISTDKVTYEKLAVNMSDGLKAKLDAKTFEGLKNNIKNNFGDYKDSKLYIFERSLAGDKDRVMYVASFSKEEHVLMVFGFDKDAKISEIGLNIMQQQNAGQAQNAEQQTAQQ